VRRFSILFVLTACSSEAQQDVKEAGEALERTGKELGQAAQKTAEQVDDAGDQLSAELDGAREKLSEAKEVADQAGDAYMDRADGQEAGADSVRCEAEHYSVERKLVDQAIANPMKLAGETSIEPVAGKGYRVTRIDPESPVAKLDVRVGDILVEVDGTRVSNLDGARLVTRLKETSEVSFTVERNGEDVRKTVTIES
jgi:C-terminal processing protease CtpA/Prc